MITSFSFNFTSRISRFKSQYSKAQAQLDNRVIKDTDSFVPMRTGQLAKSVKHSAIGRGVVVYDTPYAREVYYAKNLKFSRAKHPDAQPFWFEASKKRNISGWVRLVRGTAGGR